MGEDVAVVDKAGVLPQLVGRHVEVSAFSRVYFLIEIGLGPPDTVLQDLMPVDKGSVFPLAVEFIVRRRTIILDVLVASSFLDKEIQTTDFI
jgi:hypothetical protein